MRSLAVARRLAGALAFGMLLAGASAASAMPLPAAQRPVRQTAQNVPIGVFLQQLVGASGFKARVSPRISGTVSGVFEGPLDEVLARLGRAFGAAYYYDGQTIAFYPIGERESATLALTPERAQWVRSEAQRNRLLDAEDQLQVRGAQLLVSGAHEFIGQIQALAGSAPRPADTGPPPRAATRSSGQPPPSDPVEYRVYRLHYGWAADTRLDVGDRSILVPGLATLLRRIVLGSGEFVADAEGDVSTRPAAQKGLAGTGLASQGKGDAEQAHSPLTTLGAYFGSVEASAAKAQEPAAPAAAQARHEAAGGFRVEADPRLNALIVRDSRANLDGYAALIAALDVEPSLVEIQATIIDVDVERAKQSGVSLSYEGADGSGFTSNLNGVIPDFPQAGGISVSAVIGNKNRFIAQLQALESQGVARIVSSPLVMTLSDVPASFQNDRTFYVPVNGSLSTDLYNVTAGTNLRVTPHVTQDMAQDRIRLTVEIDDGSVSEELVGSIPIVQKASLNTQALIVPGQSLLVGGMISQADDDYHARVPGVAGLPVVGGLFRASRKTSSHVERLFLITPHLRAVGQAAVSPAAAQAIPPQAQAETPVGVSLGRVQ